MFTPELNTWEYGPKMSAPRFTTAGAALNGALYVAGGFDGAQYLNSVERLDPRMPDWHLVRTSHIVIQYNDIPSLLFPLHTATACL